MPSVSSPKRRRSPAPYWWSTAASIWYPRNATSCSSLNNLRRLRASIMLSSFSHPALSDCRRLFLRNYEVQINIGVHEFEKKGEQRVLINVDLFIPLAVSTPKGDHLYEV